MVIVHDSQSRGIGAQERGAGSRKTDLTSRQRADKQTKCNREGLNRGNSDTDGHSPDGRRFIDIALSRGGRSVGSWLVAVFVWCTEVGDISGEIRNLAGARFAQMVTTVKQSVVPHRFCVESP